MTILEWVSTNSRALGKIGLYGTGAFLIGHPVVRFVEKVYGGQGISDAAQGAIYEDFGIGVGSNVNQANLKWGFVRTGLGALAILAARKI